MEKTFENAITELEEVIKNLENGELTLDQSMEQFKKGVELAQICNSKLDETEKSIKMLVENSDGTTTEKDFEVKGEDNAV